MNNIMEVTDDAVERVQKHGDMCADCCLEYSVEGSEQWHKGIVKEVIAWWDDSGNYAYNTEREGVVFFKTDTEKFAVLADGEDYTGHG